MLVQYIVVQRRVYAHLNFSDSPPHDLKIENDLVISCINALSKYKEHNSKNKTADRSKEHDKMEALLTKTETSKRQKMELSKTIVMVFVKQLE